MFQEQVSAATAERRDLKRLLATVSAGDVVLVTRLDRLARSTLDLLNILASISKAQAAFKSLGDAWMDTASPHGRC